MLTMSSGGVGGDKFGVATNKTVISKMTKKGKVKYKKAPQAPRRFKSAYMFFSTEKHKVIREKLGEKGESEKTTTIAKLVSQAWKELTPEEREPWDELARKDKERFEVEKTLYTGPWKVPAKKSQKNPNAPKRPMSAFLSYSHARRAQVKRDHSSMNNAEISRLLAQMWKTASQEEKKDFIDQEYELRQKYLTDIAVWRETTEKEISEQRRHREEIAMQTLEARKNGGPDPTGIEAAYGGVSGVENQGNTATAAAYYNSGGHATNFFSPHAGYAPPPAHDPYQHAYNQSQYMHSSYAQNPTMAGSVASAPVDSSNQISSSASDGYHQEYAGGSYGGYYGHPHAYPPMRQDSGGGNYGGSRGDNPSMPHYFGSDGYGGGYHPPPGYGHPQHPSGYYDHYGNQHHYPNDYGASMYNVQTGGMGDRLPESNDLSGTEGISPTPVRMSKEDHDGHRVDRASSPQE